MFAVPSFICYGRTANTAPTSMFSSPGVEPGRLQSTRSVIPMPVWLALSTTSLEHTNRLKEKYNLTNLDVRQLAIENVKDLDQQFDHVIATGVLHHLDDPEAGLRALRSVLRRDGLMYLMVYAPYGRTGVYMMQEYCRVLGVGPSDQEMDDLISTFQALPQHHPLLGAQGGSREFQSSAALIDALLNPVDRPYSVTQLFEFLEHCEMVFGRWYWQAAYLPQCGSITRTPHAARISALPEREQYIAMELFRGMLASHSFVAYRNDADNAGPNVRFDDNYLRYVPVRLPFTICVQHSLPPGAAGVLVNQSHIFSDLFVMINAQEKQMFDAIDGRRTIAEIVEGVNDAPDARGFFEKLWRYDQVVFDTSKD
jgi:SAM-dependent methyltransferase